MSRLYKIICAVFILTVFGVQTCFGEVTINVSENNITVTGDLGSQNSETAVSIQVIKPKSNIDGMDPNHPELILPYTEYLGQAYTDTSGNLIPYTFSQYGASGIYEIRLKTENMDSPIKKTYQYSNAQDLINAIASINSVLGNSSLSESEQSEQLKNIIETNCDILQIKMNFPLYDELIAANVSLANVYRALALDSSLDYTSFITQFKKETLLVGINAGTAAKIKAYITDYVTLFDFNQVMKNKYDSLGSSKQSETASILSAADYSNYESFGTAFNEAVFLTEINNIKIYGDIEDILNDTASIVGISLDKLNHLSSSKKALVMQGLAKKKYVKFSDFVNELDDLIDEYSVTTENGGSGSGSGGSSSGGSSGSKTDYISASSSVQNIQTQYFTDLDSVSWAEEAICKLYEKGIIAGKKDRAFTPNDNITREEFIKILVGALGLSGEKNDIPFTDVDKGEWYYTYISTAYSKNIISGMDDGNFGVAQPITRQDIAAMILRAAKVAGIKLENVKYDNFADDDEISQYAKEAIYVLKESKIINGSGDNKFMPKSFATRAEAAKIIYGLIGGINE